MQVCRCGATEPRATLRGLRVGRLADLKFGRCIEDQIEAKTREGVAVLLEKRLFVGVVGWA